MATDNTHNSHVYKYIFAGPKIKGYARCQSQKALVPALPAHARAPKLTSGKTRSEFATVSPCGLLAWFSAVINLPPETAGERAKMALVAK